MSLLPAGYKRLAYIESNGTQHVDSGFKPNNNTRVVMDFKPTEAYSSMNAYFGARDTSTSSTAPNQYVLWNNGAKALRSDYFKTNVSLTIENLLTRKIADKNKNVTTVDGVTATNTANTGQCSYNMLLFAVNNAGTPDFKAKIQLYSCQIYDNGTLVRNFLPCESASGVVGLYDTVGGAFYGNDGTGSFVTGPERSYAELEYIESTGSQYVDANVKPNNNIRVVMKFQSRTASASLFGAQTAWGSASFSFGTNTASFGANGNTSLAYNDGIEHVVDFNKGVLKVDGSTVFNWSGSFTIPYNLFILANNEKNATTYYSTARLYYCQIYDNDTLIRDYIPVKLCDGSVGLLDKITDTFYGNSGTGAFVAGPEFARKWRLVEYVEASGGQYINLGFKPNQLTRMLAEVQPASAGAMAISAVDAGWLKNGFGVYTNTSEFGSSNYGITASVERRVFELNKGQLSVGGKVLTTLAGTFQSAYNLVIFALNRSGTMQEYFSGKLYRYALYDNGVLLYDLKPCRLLDGRVGLIDESTGIFFENATATPLIAGPDIITVPLAPEGLTANVSSGVLTLSWTASESAEGYDVYRNGEYVATTFDTTFTDAINPAIAYEYGVTAYNEHGESEMSTVAVPATQVPEQVADLRAMDAGFNYITLTWYKVAGADAYRIYREGVLLSEQEESGYSDRGLETETAYTYGVSAVNEVGESAMVEITVSTTEFKLVTDRTAADVQRALDLSKALPAENMEEWLAGMKGSYNVFDLNRVELAVLYVIERLRIAGWYITVESKTDWKFSDFPTVSEMARYLNNIRKLRASLPAGLPAVPADMDGFTYSEANDIERLLEMLDAAVTNIMANVFYSNELYSGEVQ